MVDGAPATGAPAAPAAPGTPAPPAPTAPSVEEASKLLDAFKEAGIDNPAGALDTIKKLRDYEKGEKLPASVERELAELKDKLKEAEDAKLSDSEKLRKELDGMKKAQAKAERDARDVRVNAAIASAARKAGAIDPDAMSRLIDADQVEFDKKGEPTNIAELVEELKKDKPVWFGEGGAGSFDGGARGRGVDGKPSMDELLRSASH